MMDYILKKEKYFIMVLFLLKAILFDYFIEINLNHIWVVFISFLYFIIFMCMVDFLEFKWNRMLKILFLFLTSLIMFCDVVYFKYFNQLPSVRQLLLVNQLSAVSESINEIIKPKFFILFLDLFIYLYYSFKVKITFEDNKFIIKQFNQHAIAAICIIILLGNSFISYSREVAVSSEFFTYHMTDIYENINQKDSNTPLKIKKKIYASKNLFEKGKDKNLIVIQVESLQDFVINRKYEGQEITPNLNKLVGEKNTIYFDQYYQELGRGNTSDAEFVTNNSLHPSMMGPTYSVYEKNTFYGLPWILRDHGYKTLALHGYTSSFWNREKAYPNQGFEKFYSEKDFTIHEPVGFGLNDKEFFDQSIAYLKKEEGPFYAFLVTLSSHNPYRIPDKFKGIHLKKEHEDTLFGDYIQSIHFTDEALGLFLEKLKESGLYENSIIAIYGDHYGLSCKDEETEKIMNAYLGHQYDFDEMMNIPLIINIPEMEEKINKKITGGQIDFMPTVLNILGIENEKGIMFGQDLINAKDGFAVQQTYMVKGSFIDNEKIFSLSRDGIFKNSRAWKLDTKEVVDLNFCRIEYERAIDEINQSDYILRTDYLKSYLSGENAIQENDLKKPKYIIKANKENINNSYKEGYRFFLLDHLWTEDENLLSWIENHEDAYIITKIQDKKYDNLIKIQENYPDMIKRIIPQIYTMNDYLDIQSLGYENILFSLEENHYKDNEIIDFVNRNPVFSVLLPVNKINTKLSRKLNNQDIPLYTKIKNVKEENQLSRYVTGFFIEATK